MKQLQVSETELGNATHTQSTLQSQIKSKTDLYNTFSQRISELKTQEERFPTRIIQISSSIESLEQRINLVKQNYSDTEQTSIANKLSFLNEKKSSWNTERSTIVKQLSETEASIAVVEDRKKLRKSALLQEQTSMSKEKTELESTVAKAQTEMHESSEKLTKLRDKEQ